MLECAVRGRVSTQRHSNVCVCLFTEAGAGVSCVCVFVFTALTAALTSSFNVSGGERESAWPWCRVVCVFLYIWGGQGGEGIEM